MLRARADVLLEAPEMWRMLQRERLRSDRNRIPFALVALQVVGDDAGPLLRVIRERLRATDVAGHLQYRLLGIFLPDTPEEGAWKVLEEILAALPRNYPEPQFDVFVHPEPTHTTKPHDDHNHRGNPHDGSGTNGHSNRNGVPHADNGRARQRFAGVPSRPLGWLFAQPLPWWKRAIDIVGATAGLAILSPVLLTAAAAVRLTSPGPIFFFQPREGLGGRAFTMWKFRTMVVEAEALKSQLSNEQDGPAFKMQRDPRVTRVGWFLRNTSIDELPQFINVLRGEMSLVGPRPLPIAESQACESWQRRRLDVTPGLTCFWQASRKRSEIPFQQWMRMDLRYAQRRSPVRDLLLIAQTAAKVVLRWRTG